MSKQHNPGSVLDRGQMIRDLEDPAKLASHPENAAMIRSMFRRYRFERVMSFRRDASTQKWVYDKPTEEWVIVGQRGQCYEQGIGKLGVTIEGGKRLKAILRTTADWLHPHQIGDGEGNLWCAWTEENILKAAQLVGLARRRGAWKPKMDKNSVSGGQSAF